MQTVYKLTRKDCTTYNGYAYTPGVWHVAPGKGNLCSDGWLHAYEHPLLALLHNPIHAALPETDMLLWEASGDGVVLKDGQMKLGVERLRLDKQLEITHPTLEQRVAYGILAVVIVCNDPQWRQWAKDWLGGIRGRSSKTAVVNAIYAAANAVNAANAAAYVAYAAHAAAAYAASAAADAAAYDARAVASAAYAAANDARAVANRATINLIHCAEAACGDPSKWVQIFEELHK